MVHYLWLQGLDWTTRQGLGFRRGKVASLETLRRVLQGVDVVALAKPSTPRLGIALDGRVLRGSGDGAVPALRVLNAVVHQVGAMLLSHPIPREQRSWGWCRRCWKRWSWRGGW